MRRLRRIAVVMVFTLGLVLAWSAVAQAIPGWNGCITNLAGTGQKVCLDDVTP
jgi:hypothetical protein